MDAMGSIDFYKWISGACMAVLGFFIMRLLSAFDRVGVTIEEIRKAMYDLNILLAKEFVDRTEHEKDLKQLEEKLITKFSLTLSECISKRKNRGCE
jgi:DNA-binding transcriptional MerR regulator